MPTGLDYYRQKLAGVKTNDGAFLMVPRTTSITNSAETTASGTSTASGFSVTPGVQATRTYKYYAPYAVTIPPGVARFQITHGTWTVGGGTVSFNWRANFKIKKNGSAIVGATDCNTAATAIGGSTPTGLLLGQIATPAITLAAGDYLEFVWEIEVLAGGSDYSVGSGTFQPVMAVAAPASSSEFKVEWDI